MEPNLEKLREVHGEILELVTPSGYKVIIREQTGEDDDILSNAKDVLDATSSNRFLSGIVLHCDYTDNGKLNLDDARNVKLCDKYFIMIASRIFSLGQIVKFSYTWPDKLEVDYEEDLGLLIWDYHDEKKPFPVEGDKDYWKYRIPPHPFGKEANREITLESGKIISYAFINGVGEKWLMDLPEDRQSVNVELLARGIEQKIGKDWVKVQNFKKFTPREMIEIRKDVEKNDTNLSLISDLEHPHTKQVIQYPIMGSPDFFFPREI